MHLLRQSTAATVLVGPVLDSSGTIYTAAVIGDFNITKNGTTAAMAAGATATHSHNGHYLIALTTGNTDTLGRAAITCNNTTYAMPPARYELLSGPTFDAIVTNAAATAGGLLTSNASNAVAVTGTVVAASVTAPVIAASVTDPVIAASVTAPVIAASVTAPVVASSVTAPVTLNLTQPLDTSNTGDTVGGALIGARAQAFGKWVFSGTTLTLYAADGTTVVRAFALDSASSPTQRI